MAMNVLVTDGENRSALAVTRSLGKKGYRVVVTASHLPCLASASRYCFRSWLVGDPLHEGAKYAATLIMIAAKERIDIIIPMTEASIHLLNQRRADFPSQIVFACSSQDKMMAVSNKVELCRLAEKLNVAIPRTFYLSDSEDLETKIGLIHRYPVVVKPALSKIPKKNGFISSTVKYASSPDELIHLYATNQALRYPSMVQEKIKGPGTGLFTLFDKNRHLALFSHRRLREKPPSGGVSVVSQSVALDETMVEAAERLLSSVKWQGVAMIEFKRDLRDGRAKLMEINGRFWGSLQLAIASGIDFPGLLLDLLQGNKPPATVKEYLIGHKLSWFFGTLDHLLIRLMGSRTELNLSADAPSKWQAVKDFFEIVKKDHSYDVFDLSDPRPFVFEAGSYLRQLGGIR